MHLLPPGGAEFLLALQDGEPLGRAAERASGQAPGFDLGANLGAIFAAQVIKSISV